MQFGDETVLLNHMCDWSKSFKEGRTEVGNVGKLNLLQGNL
jgi:hypothetical protein